MDILLAGKNRSLRTTLGRAFGSRGYACAEAGDLEGLLEAAGRRIPKLLVLEIELDDGDGLRVLPPFRKRAADVPVVVLANGSPPERLAQAMKVGATECVTGDPDPDALARRAVRLLKPGFHSVLTHGHRAIWTEATQDVYDSLKQAAASEATLLITGETGTGKEVAARTVHELSPRRRGPYVAVNCAALSEHLLESEIFGHEKGAFTNATRTRAGRLETAGGGTLLFDEISELPPGLQAKLLRVLQEGTYERVGSDLTRRVEARIIATSNRDLKAEVRSRRFREDLFFRLDVLGVLMPPLRERKTDIPFLLDLFLQRLKTSVAPEVLETLERYAWPGNVRELENLARRWIASGAEHQMRIGDLPSEIRDIRPSPGLTTPSSATDLVVAAAEAERSTLVQALAACSGDRTRAALRLGISLSTLKRRLRAFGLTRPWRTSAAK